MFATYKSGILNDENCGDHPDHEVAAIEYGIENGHEYYIIKNVWGDNGYVKIQRRWNVWYLKGLNFIMAYN